ncbi:MAG: endonuclease/exonuclease/phosphatase family protein [Firmicutes bacterium]|nr:endonuclease/exonuclease/phosphatase family protein [Bacillota bacterium]
MQGSRKKRRIIRTSALMASLCLLLCACSGKVDKKDVLNDEKAIRVMSFNISGWNYKNTKNLVPRVIEEYDPDLVGLQECTYDFYKKLSSSLPQYEWIGVGRESGDRSKNCGEMSAILYRKDKFSVIDSGTFWLSETPDQVSKGWDGDYIRICTWAVLENRETGKRLAHVNTHLENVDDGSGWTAQEKGAAMVLEKTLSFDLPLILTGDLNFEKSSRFYQSYLDAGMQDTQEIAASSMEGLTCGEEHIDYILVNPAVGDVLSYKIVRDSYDGKFPSDHYPIYADIRFGKE